VNRVTDETPCLVPWAGNSVLLCGADLVDGTGSPARQADVLVREGRIAAVEAHLDRLEDVPTIDLRGRELMPGFIDVHTHDDLAILSRDGCEPKLRQGVTTSVLGNCGLGCAPSTPGGDLESYSAPVLGPSGRNRHWSRFTDYLDELERTPTTINSVCLVPHHPLRVAAMGIESRVANRSEVADMASALDEAMTAGAAGLSFGLLYAPGNAAEPSELHRLAEVVASHGGIVAAHVRNEADHVQASVDEIVDLAKATGVAIQISHLKVTSPRNFGSMPHLLKRLEDYRSSGIDVMADVYPYEAGSTTTSTLLPSWAVEQGPTSIRDAVENPRKRERLRSELSRRWTEPGQENFVESIGAAKLVLAGFTRPANLDLEGSTLADIAVRREVDPIDCLIDLLGEEGGALTAVIFHTDPVGMREVLAWPHALIGSDGLPRSHGYVHPRLYGAFSRVLAEYSGVGKLLSRTEAVRRMSGASAARFGVGDRGTIEPGSVADLVVIDPARLQDRASFVHPRRHPNGFELVAVAGRPVWSQDARTTVQRGSLLRSGNHSGG